MHAPGRVLFIFLDGCGIGANDPGTNPFLNARLPTLTGLLGGERLVQGVHERVPLDAPACVVPADATMGVTGRPQSGTGQTALLTGINAAEMLGRHFGPWVHTGLRTRLASENILRKAVDAGRSVAFANAYPAGYLKSDRGRRPRPSAPPLAALSVGALDRDSRQLREGSAVASSIVNGPWQERLDRTVPDVSAAQAGANLAKIARTADLTLFAHYDTDLAGHKQEMDIAVAVLELVDSFLAGVTANLASDTTVIIGSDHGNIEDITTGHTLNPVPIIALGPGRHRVKGRIRTIMDVAPAVLDLLAVPD